MSASTYPVTKSFLSTNGSEPLWQHYETFYGTTGRMGSNCYSFAMDDFRKEGQRVHKAVPGDVSDFVAQNRSLERTAQLVQFRNDLRKRPFDRSVNWRTCSDPVYRMLMDGRAASILHRASGIPLRYDSTVVAVSRTQKLSAQSVRNNAPFRTRTVSRALTKRLGDGWRKVVMVVDGEHPGNDSTDFHFFAQCRLPLWNLYNVPLRTMIKAGRRVDLDGPENNVYIAANINAFTSRQDILQRHLSNHSNHLAKRIERELLAPRARALTNLRIHLRRIPDCALWYVPRPFWLFDVDRHALQNPKKHTLASYRYLMEIMRRENNRRGIHVLQVARGRAMRLLRSKNNASSSSKIKATSSRLDDDEVPLHTEIGIWGEKAGWASSAMNADGSGKLIFDPNLADRDHGAYDYDTVCVVIGVLSGYGMTSVPLSLVN